MTGFPGYLVTAEGKVYSCHRPGPGGRRVWRPLVLFQRTVDGYYWATLYLSGTEWKKVTVRTLVAEAFLGPKPPGTKLRTLDGNPANHAIGNLAYLTDAEAKAHGLLGRHLPRGTGHHDARLTPEKVTAIRAFVHAGGTLREASRRWGTTHQNCKAIVERHTWNHVADGFPPLKVGPRKPPKTNKLTPAQVASIKAQAVTGRPAYRIWKSEFAGVCCRHTVLVHWRQARAAAGLPLGDPRQRKDKPCPPPTGTSG